MRTIINLIKDLIDVKQVHTSTLRFMKTLGFNGKARTRAIYHYLHHRDME